MTTNPDPVYRSVFSRPLRTSLDHNAHDHTEGTGHLYQGRFKAFPIEEDDPLDAVLRYVERNPVRAELCERTDD